MKFIARALALVMTCAAYTVSAQTLSKDQKLQDFQQLVGTIKSGYGPLQYKEKDMGINFLALTTRYENAIANTTTNHEFYYLITRFVAEFKDGHFGAMVPTDYVASLPFSTDLVQGKVIITEVSPKAPAAAALKVGTEILAMNGTAIADVLNDISQYVGNGFEGTVRKVSAWGVPRRSGRRMPVPTGKVTLLVQDPLANFTREVEMEWDVKGTPLDEVDVKRLKLLNTLAPRTMDFADLSIRRELESFMGPEMDRKFICSGGTRVEIPKDATMIMEEPFVAYYHPTSFGNVGYLRIPHYMPVNQQTGEDESELRLAQYTFAISVLEKNTVGLIIDQDHNCGGSVVFLENLVGLFMDKTYKAQNFRLLANKAQYLEFKKWMSMTSTTTLDYQDLVKVSDLILNSWKAGEFLTPMTSITGRETYEPSAIRYTKPIVMLIDEMSGSGGDAFPALMQGYGRAKLLGTRTMGAGGHVQPQAALLNSQIEYSMTKSLFFRPDGVAVENNGAVPDYPYEITLSDVLYGFKDYQKFYLQKLEDVINGK